MKALSRLLSPVFSKFCLKNRRGFTLLEMVVAGAVLAILMVVVFQIVSGSSILAAGSKKRLDAEGQARLALSRIGEDLSRMLKRTDVDYIFSSQPGNDSMYFYSEAPAYYSSVTMASNKGNVALVGYRIRDHKLERLAKGLLWSGPGTSVVFLSKDSSGTIIPGSRLDGAWNEVGNSPNFDDYDGSADNPPLFQTLADGVVRLEICFQKKDGAFTNNPNLAATGVTDQIKDISALVVSIAVLDDASRKLIPSAKLEAISNVLTDPVAADWAASPPLLIVEKWRAIVASSNFAANLEIPVQVASQIRVYQRTYYLNQP